MSIMTVPFVDAAELMARVQGVPAHPFATIDHPIASADSEGLEARARAAVEKAFGDVVAGHLETTVRTSGR